MLRRSLRALSAVKASASVLRVTPYTFTSNLSTLVQSKLSTASHSRVFSSTAQNVKGSELSKKLLDEDEYDDYEEAKTFSQKVRWFGVLFIRLGFLMVGFYFVYVTGAELFPGRMGANNLFNAAFEQVRTNAAVIAMAGEGMVAFGKDVGKNTEGRRNHVEQFKYVADDGSNRTRIRFNVKGSKGKVAVWAEVCDSMNKGELVYLICQDTRTGKVHTVVDNRRMLDERPPVDKSSAGSVMDYLKIKW